MEIEFSVCVHETCERVAGDERVHADRFFSYRLSFSAVTAAASPVFASISVEQAREVLCSERLLQIGIGRPRLLGDRVVPVARDDDDRELWIVELDDLEELEAVDIGKLYVDDRALERHLSLLVGLEGLQALHPVLAGLRLIPFLHETHGNASSEGRFVVDQQDSLFHNISPVLLFSRTVLDTLHLSKGRAR